MNTSQLRHTAVSLTIFFTLATTAFAQFVRGNNLSGTYRIGSAGIQRLWHEFGTGDRLVTTRYYAEDDSTRFILERQPDGSYRIRNKATNLYLHVDGGADQLLSTRYQSNDDFTRFIFDRQPNQTFRIRVKATGRYLHCNAPDYLVSTRFQVADASTTFDLLPANFRPTQQVPAPPITTTGLPPTVLPGAPVIPPTVPQPVMPVTATTQSPPTILPVTEQLLAIKPIHPLALKLITGWISDGVMPVATKISLNAVYHNESLYPYANNAVFERDGWITYHHMDGETHRYQRQDLGGGRIRLSYHSFGGSFVPPPLIIDAHIGDYPFHLGLYGDHSNPITLKALNVDALSSSDGTTIQPPKFLKIDVAKKKPEANDNPIHPLAFLKATCWPEDPYEPLALEFCIGGLVENSNQFDYTRYSNPENKWHSGGYRGRTERGEPDLIVDAYELFASDVMIIKNRKLVTAYSVTFGESYGTLNISGKTYQQVPHFTFKAVGKRPLANIMQNYLEYYTPRYRPYLN